ncbi:MAG: FAD-binding protein [Betaproteobacteria bacterium]|nr:MAG: FAD-binding protein [Betaproteobacteria bacterium]
MHEQPEVIVESTDILIAGSGAAGMRAAIAGHDTGAKVVLLAKGPRRANHTRMSGGRYNAVSGANPKDTPEAFYRDTVESGMDINNHELARILAYEAMDRAYDLEAYGLAWDRTEVEKYYMSMTGGGTFVRTLGSIDEGIGITEVMLHQLHARNVRICDFHMLVDVIVGEDGRVAGALALDLSRGVWRFYRCPTVIIATGGTSQLYETSSGPAINTGDGIAIALRAGAELVDIEFMQFIPISFVYPPSARGYTLTEPAHYGMRHFDPNAEAAHLVNNQGERFVLKHDPVRKEGSTRDVLARAIMLEILEGRGTPEGGVLMLPDKQVFEAFLKERPTYIKRLLENYGEGQARLEAPIPVMPSALYTLGGVRIDAWCRSRVPGLYAAGEAAGGVHGANRLGGSSMPDIQVFGRRAGMAAAEEAKARGPVPEEAGIAQARARASALERGMHATDGVRPIEVKKRIQKLMWDHVGLVRSGPKMEETLQQFGEIRAQVLPALKITGKSRILNREWMESIELGNLLDIAEAMASASLLRKETRGAHYRTDFPDLDPQWTANVLVKRDGAALTVEKQAVVCAEAPQTQLDKHKAIA